MLLPKDLETQCFGGNDQLSSTQLPECASNASVEFVSLVKIFSTRLLTDVINDDEEVENDADKGTDAKAKNDKSVVGERRVVFLLCALNDSSRLSELRHFSIDKPSHSLRFKWMNYAELLHAQRSYELMGLEPLAIYNHIHESTYFAEHRAVLLKTSNSQFFLVF